MKRSFLTCAISFLISAYAFGWGQKGHDTVAYIAQQHLTPVAQAAIDSLLDGYSIVYWANWLDNASHTEDYAYTKTWHYMNIDAGKSFEKTPRIKEGDIINAIYKQVQILNNPVANKEDKALALKMLVHFLGDIHQPLHMGHASDKGGNYWKLRFFKNSTNLHTLWDTKLLEAAHAWSHTEWQQEIDRLKPQQEIELLQGGNPDVWGKETFEICTQIYNNTPQDINVEYDYIADWTPTIESQLLKGGLRLADILNSIFDSDYKPLNSMIKK